MMKMRGKQKEQQKGKAIPAVRAGSILMALLLLLLLIPAGKAQAASRTGNYQKKYKAQASFPIYTQPAYGVVVNRIKNGKVRFQISKVGINASPLYNSNVINAKLKGKKASFSWKDTWGNSGTGILKFGKNLVKLKITQTYTAKMNRSTLDTGGKFVKMKKINDKRKLFTFAQ